MNKRIFFVVIIFILLTSLTFVFIGIFNLGKKSNKDHKLSKGQTSKPVSTPTLKPISVSDKFNLPYGKKAFPGSPYNQVELTGIIDRIYRESDSTIVLLNLGTREGSIEVDLGVDDKIFGYTFMQDGVLPLIQKMETGISKNLLKNLRIGDPIILSLTVNIPEDYLQSRKCNEQCKRVMKEYEKYKSSNENLFADAQKGIPTKVKRVGVVTNIVINQ